MSNNWGMNKQSVVFSYNEVLFNHNKEWCINSWYNIDDIYEG